MKNNKLLSAVLFGFTTGLAVGVLFAPGDGADTRKLIRKRGGQFFESLNNMLKTFAGTELAEEDVAENSSRINTGAAEAEYYL